MTKPKKFVNERGETYSRRARMSLELEVAAVERLLSSARVGDIVSWEQLEEATKGLTRSQVYTVKSAALKRLLPRNIHFDTLHGKGVRRISSGEVVDRQVPTRAAKVATIAESMLDTLDSVNTKELDADQRRRKNNQSTTAAAVLASSRQADLKAIGPGTGAAPTAPNRSMLPGG